MPHHRPHPSSYVYVLGRGVLPYMQDRFFGVAQHFNRLWFYPIACMHVHRYQNPSHLLCIVDDVKGEEKEKKKGKKKKKKKKKRKGRKGRKGRKEKKRKEKKGIRKIHPTACLQIPWLNKPRRMRAIN